MEKNRIATLESPLRGQCNPAGIFNMKIYHFTSNGSNISFHDLLLLYLDALAKFIYSFIVTIV